MTQKPAFFTDVHIHLEVVRQLRSKGVDIIHCSEAGMAESADVDLLTYATQHQRVMVSCDEDFELLHFDWLTHERKHAGIVFLSMEKHCKFISPVVRELMFLFEAADYESDLYNQFWRVDR